MLKFLGCVTHRWKGVSNRILQASKFLKFQLVKIKIKIIVVQHCRACLSKELKWENDSGSFLQCFLRVHSRKVLLLAMFIGINGMVDLMIIYIKKMTAKALDINDIIIKIMGMSM
jgi:hypothetical protein